MNTFKINTDHKTGVSVVTMEINNPVRDPIFAAFEKLFPVEWKQRNEVNGPLTSTVVFSSNNKDKVDFAIRCITEAALLK